MKNVDWLLVIFSAILVLFSCNKSEVNPPVTDKVLNYEMNCGKDSAFYYYTFNKGRIYLDLSTNSITVKFSSAVSEEYMNYLLEKNTELDSFSIIIEKENIAFGYLNNDCNCEKIEALLKSLTLESQILCANPNFVGKEVIASGISPDDKDAVMGMTNEFIVENHNSYNL